MSQTLALTQSGAPDAFTLTAGQLIVWDVNSIYDNPITANVSSVFITNAAEGLIQIYALHDPTA